MVLLMYSYILLMLGSIFFASITLIGFRKLRILTLIPVILFSLFFTAFVISQVYLNTFVIPMPLASLIAKANLILFHLSLGALIIYLDILRDYKARFIKIVAIILVILSILDIIYGTAYAIIISGIRFLIPIAPIHSSILFTSLLTLILYNVFVLTKHYARIFKLSGILLTIFVLLITLGNPWCALGNFPVFFNYYYEYLIELSMSINVLSSLVFFAISMMSIRSLRSIMPIEAYMVFITSRLGLKIAYRVIDKSYAEKVNIYASLLANVLALTEGLHAKKYIDVFQRYDTGVDTIIIYYGMKSVAAIVTNFDSLALRHLLKKLNNAFESRVKEIADTVVDQETIEVGNKAIDSFIEDLKGVNLL